MKLVEKKSAPLSKMSEKMLIAIVWMMFVGFAITALSTLIYVQVKGGSLFLFLLFFSSSMLAFMSYVVLRAYYKTKKKEVNNP